MEEKQHLIVTPEGVAISSDPDDILRHMENTSRTAFKKEFLDAVKNAFIENHSDEIRQEIVKDIQDKYSRLKTTGGGIAPKRSYRVLWEDQEININILDDAAHVCLSYTTILDAPVYARIRCTLPSKLDTLLSGLFSLADSLRKVNAPESGEYTDHWDVQIPPVKKDDQAAYIMFTDSFNFDVWEYSLDKTPHTVKVDDNLYEVVCKEEEIRNNICGSYLTWNSEDYYVENACRKPVFVFKDPEQEKDPFIKGDLFVHNVSVSGAVAATTALTSTIEDLKRFVKTLCPANRYLSYDNMRIGTQENPDTGSIDLWCYARAKIRKDLIVESFPERFLKPPLRWKGYSYLYTEGKII